MKQTENNEIDLLLRGLARREAARPVEAEANSAEHLDADELNSYAEQALPAAARARYTSHLAECGSCRKIVSELAASSGAHVTAQSVSQSASAGLRQKLAALFAPGLWRYAVPAVAILAFIGIGLVVLNQQTRRQFVAQNEQTAPSSPAIETSQTTSSAESQKPGDAKERMAYDSLTDSPTKAGKATDNFARSNEKNESAPKETATDLASVVPDRDNASAEKAAGAVAQTQPTYAPEPAAPPPAKPQTTPTESRSEIARRQKEEADKKKDEGVVEQEAARGRREYNEDQVAARTAKLRDGVQSQDKARTPESKRASGAGEKTRDDEAETRTVSGRRFRRQGNVWIDTAFQSSAATTVVTRGSEQFRALIADEPGVRAIAAQLPGEVVVVWKGRAYRIR